MQVLSFLGSIRVCCGPVSRWSPALVAVWYNFRKKNTLPNNRSVTFILWFHPHKFRIDTIQADCVFRDWVLRRLTRNQTATKTKFTIFTHKFCIPVTLFYRLSPSQIPMAMQAAKTSTSRRRKFIHFKKNYYAYAMLYPGFQK